MQDEYGTSVQLFVDTVLRLMAILTLGIIGGFISVQFGDYAWLAAMVYVAILIVVSDVMEDYCDDVGN